MKARARYSMIAAALAVAPAMAQAEAGQFYLNPFVGYQWHDSDTNLDDSQFWGIGFEKQFNDHWGVELQYSKDGDAEIEDTGIGVDAERIGVDGIYYTPKISMFQPYLKLGLGNVKYDAAGFTDNGTEVGAGLGARLLFSDHWSARLEAKMLHMLDDSLTHSLVTFGVSYAFGDVAKPAPVVVAPPAPAPVPEKCADTDNDGVCDSADQCPNTPPGKNVDALGCDCDFTLALRFEFNSAELTAEDKGTLDQLAAVLANPKLNFVAGTIVGHTDSKGSDKYNEALSLRRAEAVSNYLQSKGIAQGSNFKVQGMGESEPVADNSTDEGRAQNRRVVIKRLDCGAAK